MIKRKLKYATNRRCRLCGKKDEMINHLNKPESIQENEVHSIPWYFEIQTDPLITIRRSYLVLIKKKKITRHLVDYVVQMNHRVKKKKKKKVNRLLNT